jgi:hypothetical protein
MGKYLLCITRCLLCLTSPKYQKIKIHIDQSDKSSSRTLSLQGYIYAFVYGARLKYVTIFFKYRAFTI